MKRYISYIIALLFSLSAFSQVDSFKEAAQLYKAGEYKQAIHVYENMLKPQDESAEIYYNLGNAYYKDGAIAKSILNYERALLIAPSYEAATANLELVNSQRVDKINEIGEFFLISAVKSITNMMNSNSWAVLGLVVFISGLLLIAAYFFLKIRVIRKIGFYGAFVALFISMSAFYFSSSQKQKLEKREYAIVMTPSVTIRSTPDDKGTKLFVLHEGVKLKILSKIEGWIEIKLSDGSIGWLRSNTIEKI